MKGKRKRKRKRKRNGDEERGRETNDERTNRPSLQSPTTTTITSTNDSIPTPLNSNRFQSLNSFRLAFAFLLRLRTIPCGGIFCFLFSFSLLLYCILIYLKRSEWKCTCSNNPFNEDRIGPNRIGSDRIGSDRIGLEGMVTSSGSGSELPFRLVSSFISSFLRSFLPSFLPSFLAAPFPSPFPSHSCSVSFFSVTLCRFLCLPCACTFPFALFLCFPRVPNVRGIFLLTLIISMRISFSIDFDVANHSIRLIC